MDTASLMKRADQGAISRAKADKTNMWSQPRLEKIVVSVGLGKNKEDKKMLEVATNTLRRITGQQPVTTRARKSIAAFKLRQGMIVGLKVTLRGRKMYEFLDRLINIVLPRVRDFRGVSASAFDKQGNYNIGLVDQSVFPELSYQETAVAHGLQVSICLARGNPSQSHLLLAEIGMPFENAAAAARQLNKGAAND